MELCYGGSFRGEGTTEPVMGNGDDVDDGRWTWGGATVAGLKGISVPSGGSLGASFGASLAITSTRERAKMEKGRSDGQRQ